MIMRLVGAHIRQPVRGASYVFQFFFNLDFSVRAARKGGSEFPNGVGWCSEG